MEFKTLFPILKKYLADDADVPDFFRELMSMITTVTEEEWGTGKDPSTRAKDETLAHTLSASCLRNWLKPSYTGSPRKSLSSVSMKKVTQ